MSYLVMGDDMIVDTETGEITRTNGVGEREFWLVDTQVLIEMISASQVTEAELREERRKLEYELQLRMEQAGQKEVYHPSIKCELKAPTPVYDQGKLMGLLELIDPAVLPNGYTPAHTEIVNVDAKFSMTTVKAWGRKYGSEVQEMIDNARLPAGRGRLSIMAKPGVDHA